MESIVIHPIFAHPASLIAIGAIVGLYSGFFGLGGGTIMIPIMIFLLGLDAKMAIGTSLAIMVPALIPGVIGHYQAGHIQLHKAVWIALGMVTGTYFGARLLERMTPDTARLAFGFVVVGVAAFTAFGKEHLLRNIFMALVVVAVAVGLYLGAQWYDRTQTPSAAPEVHVQRLPDQDIF